MMIKVVALLAALCATATCIPSPSGGMQLMAREYCKDKEKCLQQGYDWDDNEKCCYDHNHNLWDWDNWNDKKDKCSKMQYDWDDNQKCCFDGEHQKWDYNHNDIDHKQKCDNKGYDWDDSQKCCFDKDHNKWNYNN